MSENFTWITPKQAGELAGYTARHIQNLIVNGKLSATKEDGKYYIDKSEFFRVFPKAHRKEQQGNSAQQAAEKNLLEFENNILKEITSQKDKEIEFLRNQIDFVSQEKVKMLDAIVNQTKLLEYKGTGSKEKNLGRKWRDFFKPKKDKE